MKNILNQKPLNSKSNSKIEDNSYVVVEVTSIPDEIAAKRFASSQKAIKDGMPYIRVGYDGSVHIVCTALDGEHLQEIHLHKVAR